MPTLQQVVTLQYGTLTKSSPPPNVFPFFRANPYWKVLPSLPSIASRAIHIQFHLIRRLFLSEWPRSIHSLFYRVNRMLCSRVRPHAPRRASPV